MPFDVAFSLDECTAAGWCIAFSEMEGHKFDWNTMSFKDEQ
ncbi:MAG: hypothetical protein ACK4MG_04210 [Aquabacterium sp.]|nr:hypothetical protein [uncultured Aquabacterium sp.]